MKSIRLLFLVVLSCISLACDSAITEPPKSTGKGERFGSLFSYSDSVYAGCLLYESKLSVYGSTSSTFFCDAYAWNGVDSMISMGYFMVNGDTLNMSDPNDDQGGIYYTDADIYDPSSKRTLVDFSYNTYQRFSATGSSAFPAWSDSALAPSSSLTILNPTMLDTVDKSNGFTITWNGASANKARIYISDTVSTPGHLGFVQDVTDNGSYTVSSGSISGLSPGPLTITVLRGNIKLSEFSTDKYFMAIVATMHELHLNMKP